MRLEKGMVGLLGLQGLAVTGIEIDREEKQVVVGIRRRFRRRTCSGCGKRVRGTYDTSTRRWRHLSLCGWKTFLEGEIRRVDCPRCGVRVEKVPWARRDSTFTRPVEDAVAWLARRASASAVARWFVIAWATVGAIVAYVVGENLPEDRFDGLEAIGVDEFYYGHGRKKVLTIVVNHLTGCLIWAGEGDGAAALSAFFEFLGPKRRETIRLVTLDMDAGYLKAVQGYLPQAIVAYDPFHVVQLIHRTLDEVRRTEVRGAPPAERKAVKGLRYALRKNPWNLKAGEAGRLRELETANRRLYRAYLLKESILQTYAYASPVHAENHLLKTIAWAGRSKLQPFRRLAVTLRKHLEGVLAAVRFGFTNARLEATCRHLRVLSARAYGFRSSGALIAMGFLYCGGIHLNLPW